MRFDLARQIADAVLYEGYVLYPYRASSAKNQFRWQFGVLAPRAYSESGGSEAWQMQTECLIEPQDSPAVDIKVRFLQIQARSADGEPPWEEGVEREADLHVTTADLLASEVTVPLDVPGGRETESEGVVRERWPISAVIRTSAVPVDSRVRLRVRVENVTPWAEAAGADRSDALRHSIAGTHVLLGVTGGSFVSLIDPPEAARSTAAACVNTGTWPVLVGCEGDRDLMLSAPIILYDYPQLAPESHGDFHDGTEIDELLTLRVMTLTDQEKREACATDQRARAIIERSDSIPQQVFEKLHGAVRSMQPAAFEEFLNPLGEAPPEQASVEIGGKPFAKGARVTIRPKRQADSMDVFLAGRTARIESVHRDVEGNTHVAVVVEDDPASDLHGWYGRFFYFGPDELEIAGEQRKEE